MRETKLQCDICRKECRRIVGKLAYSPVVPGVVNSGHANYTHHLDVGDCCQPKIFTAFRFRKRQTAQEYYNRGRKAS